MKKKSKKIDGCLEMLVVYLSRKLAECSIVVSFGGDFDRMYAV